MEEKDEETNVIEASGGKDESENENNNNNNFDKTKALSGTKRRNEDSKAQEKVDKKKFCPQYIYQQDYEEALRSLLWEPYDCRDDYNAWYFTRFDDPKPNAFTSEEPKRMLLSSSESSFTSSSSCSSVDDILIAEMKERSALSVEKRCNLNVEVLRECNKRASCSGIKKSGKDLKQPKTIEMSALLVESTLKGEEEQFSVFSEGKYTTDPVQNQMNIGIMVSDLHFKNGDGISSCIGRGEARELHNTKIGASACQYEFGSCANGCYECDGGENHLNAAYKMLVTVEGTLEPQDSNEDTHLVSPDTSLDLNDNPVRLSSSGRIEPGPSCGNVSVVNCYRAVPVSVVSTVPTIKCLNTQESVSNINIIQTNLNSNQNFSATKIQQTPPKRRNTRQNIGPAPSTSRVRTKVPTRVPTRDANKNQIYHHGTTLEKNGINGVTNIERPRSANAYVSEMKPEQASQFSSLNETPTDSNNGNLTLSHHNRSVSNPVLGNQINLVQSRFGSQQNIPIRLETHFGPNSPDGAENSQMYLMQRGGSNVDSIVQHQVAQEAENESTKPKPRTFTSTEAQTDDVPLNVHSRSVINRERRRRERRERRHQRRLHQNVLNSGNVWQTNMDIMHRDRRGLPDILNSHMPPPYSAVSMPAMPTMSVPQIHVPQPMPVPPGPQTVPHLVESPPGQPLPHQNSFRFPFPFPGGRRRAQGQMYAHEEETPKSCCGVVVTQTVSIRWFIVMISFVGVCCVIVGTVLGAVKTSGREHLTVSLLMIGVGIVLVTVSVVAWRLTSQDAPSCRSMLGLGNADDAGNEPNQRFVPRMPPSYGRPHHPYAAMMYPEFQYRPPPPSYQASMQEYRLRLLLLERPNDTAAGLQTAISPPPTYRSQAGSTLGLRPPPLCRSLPQSEYSHPPSYRSRTSSTRPTLDPNGDTLGSVNHSRNSSLLSHVSDQNGNVSQAVVNVISVMGNTVDLRRGDTDLQIDSIKLGVEEEVPIPPLRMLLNKGKRSPTSSLEETKSENVNLVTIVTVSDSNNSAPNRDHSVESDVLAHL